MILHPIYDVLRRAMLAFSHDQRQADERAIHVLHRLTDAGLVTGGEWRHGLYGLPDAPQAPVEPERVNPLADPPRPDRVIIGRETNIFQRYSLDEPGD